MSHSTKNIPGPRRRRRGFLGSMELVLALPILFVVLLGAVEFSCLFLARGEVLAASRTGARLACQPGVHHEDVTERVREVLDPRFRDVADIRVQTAEYPGEVVTVAIAIPKTSAAPDLLWPIGLGLDGMLLARTNMVRE